MFRCFSRTAPGITVFCLCVLLGAWFSSLWLPSPVSVANVDAPSVIQQLQQKLTDQQAEIMRLQRQQVQLRSKLRKDYTKLQQQHLELLGRYESLKQRMLSLESMRLLWIQTLRTKLSKNYRTLHQQHLELLGQHEALQRQVLLLKSLRSLWIRTQPPGATVWINGKQQPGVTPMLRSLPMGRYQIKLTLANHHDYERTLELQGASSSEVVVRLMKLRVAGEEVNIVSIGAKASYIPAGTFTMGSPSDDSESSSDERPQRQVTISRGFWMMRTEVTEKQFQSLMNDNPSSPSRGDDCPVTNVSWHKAAEFANVLSEKEGLPKCFSCSGSGANIRCSGVSEYVRCKGWRLPTEAEWEYAARAQTTGARYGALDSIAWYSGNANSRTQVVGGKLANQWGLYDMLGNVWEWCYDVYGEYKNVSGKVPDVDPYVVLVDASKGDQHVLRGGSWYSIAQDVRSAGRYRDASSDGVNNVGFRLSRSFP